MKHQCGFLIDMDGVIYSGGQLIPGAADFIGELLEQDRPFRFLTNNSQRTRRDIMTRLNRLGIPVQEKHIYTCADATATYLARQKPGGTAYVIGEGGLLTALHEQGFSVVDRDPLWVIGECRTFNAEMMEAALNLLIGGAKLIATNGSELPHEPRYATRLRRIGFMLNSSARKPSVSASQARCDAWGRKELSPDAKYRDDWRYHVYRLLGGHQRLLHPIGIKWNDPQRGLGLLFLSARHGSRFDCRHSFGHDR